MGRRKTIRVILEADKADDLILGLRAARWLLDKPASQGDAIIAYGEEPTIDFLRPPHEDGRQRAQEL